MVIRKSLWSTNDYLNFLWPRDAEVMFLLSHQLTCRAPIDSGALAWRSAWDTVCLINTNLKDKHATQKRFLFLPRPHTQRARCTSHKIRPGFPKNNKPSNLPHKYPLNSVYRSNIRPLFWNSTRRVVGESQDAQINQRSINRWSLMQTVLPLSAIFCGTLKLAGSMQGKEPKKQPKRRPDRHPYLFN